MELEARPTGTRHVRRATVNAMPAANNISKVLPRTLGASEGRRKLSSHVAESIALHAAAIRTRTCLKLKTNRMLLERTQRLMGTRITRCYGTVSNEAVFVLARTTLWTLIEEERDRL